MREILLRGGQETLVDDDIYEIYKDASLQLERKKRNNTCYVTLIVRPDGSFAQKRRRLGDRSCNGCGRIIKKRSLCSTCNVRAYLERKQKGLTQKQGWNKKRKYKERDKKVPFHRLILKAPKGMMVDHINGNGLDNRKENLRICTSQLNQYNSKLQAKKTSGYRGVFKQGNQWVAKIGVNKKIIYLGMFNSEKDAHQAYIETAQSIAGNFLRI